MFWNSVFFSHPKTHTLQVRVQESKPLLKQMKPSTLAVLLWSSTPTTNSFFLKLLERFYFRMILQHRIGSEESTFCSGDDSRQSSGYFLSSEPGCCCGVARDKQEHSWGKSSLSLMKEIWTCPDRSLSLTTHTAEVSTLTLRTAGFHWNVLRLLRYRYHSNSSLTRTAYGEHESPVHTHHTHTCTRPRCQSKPSHVSHTGSCQGSFCPKL